jgi:parvulin-like peptidyl-prolyl isomerase
MRRLGAVSALCVLVCIAFGCGTDEGVLARVGDVEVEVSDFQEHLVAATDEPWQSVTDSVASRLLDQFLDQEIVLVAAGQDGRTVPPSEPVARSTRVRRLLDELCGPPPAPDEGDVETGVAAAQSAVRPARAHVRQMLLDTLEEAEAARIELDEGADFKELSRRVSRAPNAAGGGDLGMLTEGGLPVNLDEVIFALSAGEISEAVPGPSGYHIFQVLEVFPAGPPPRGEVEPEVRRRLGEIAARAHASECVRRLAEEVGVTVVQGQLWFRYEGRYAEVIHAS